MHNEHWWSFNNPHLVRETHHQVRFSANVRAIIKNKIIGPIFIDGTLTGPKYFEMLENTIEDLVEEVPVCYHRNFYFQHDGAPLHYAVQVRNYLNRKYNQNWLGRGGPVPWPARSPDLTPLDSYLWGEVKRLVYVEEAQSLENLKTMIINAFDKVKSDTSVLNKLNDNLFKRARLCLTIIKIQ